MIKNLCRGLAATALAFAVFAPAFPAHADAYAFDARAGRTEPGAEELGAYVVTLAPGADPARVMRETGITEARYVYRSVLRGFAAELNEAQLAAVQAHPDVTGVERDGGVAGAPLQPWGWVG
ncbi:protease inhibitor I9 family protein [Streptomyces sp. NBC_00096]|uniref:protease inhibitor I9 family protein n=1 Tax=Streptomyces sp. NBC_00096 TaxID=2975650 RepID=UPI00324C26C7